MFSIELTPFRPAAASNHAEATANFPLAALVITSAWHTDQYRSLPRHVFDSIRESNT